MDYVIYTIGHSNHSIPGFVGLLNKYKIELVVDVRSVPYSKYVPHFSKTNIEPFLISNKIEYLYMGKELGGKPENPKFRTGGNIDYQLIKDQEWFQNGLNKLIKLCKKKKLVTMCAEEDPNNCHREKLIATELRKNGIKIGHIRKEGLDMDNSTLDQYF